MMPRAGSLLVAPIGLSLTLTLSFVALVASSFAWAASSITAKEALLVAKEKAVAWQSDAALTSMGADVDKTGRVSSPVGWHLSFWSRKANRDLNISIGANKQVLKTEEPKFHGVLKPFTGDFIDSDKALAEALAHGLPDGLVLHATLAAVCPADSRELLCWEILSLSEARQVTYVVGAKGGKLISKK